MADLNVSMIGASTERIQPSQVANTAPKAADTLIEQNKDDSSRKEHIKEVLEDVIAVSKDGDTAQASKDAKDKLKENEDIGDVKELKNKTSNEPSAAKKLLDELKKEQESKPSPAEQAKKNAEKAKARIEESKAKQNSVNKEDSFAKKQAESGMSKVAANEQPVANRKQNVKSFDSYTDAQLRQMYINGDISRYDYDHELSHREETSDIRSIEERSEKVFREGIVRALKNENKAELSGENIDRSFDEEANDNMKAEQRMAMIDAAELTG